MQKVRHCLCSDRLNTKFQGLLTFLFLIAYLSLKISLRCRNNYSKLIAMGSGTILVGQSIMHLAVASGAMPTTGLPLPLISYGSSSISMTLVTLAIVLKIGYENPRQKKNLRMNG